MITEIENYLIDKTRTSLITLFPSVVVTSVNPQSVSKLPCVTINEIDNAPVKDNATAEEMENYTRLSYEIGVYADGDGKKNVAKKIADIVNTTFQRYGFIRTYYSQVPNIDTSVYRVMMRFSGIASKKDANNKHTIYN